MEDRADYIRAKPQHPAFSGSKDQREYARRKSRTTSPEIDPRNRFGRTSRSRTARARLINSQRRSEEEASPPLLRKLATNDAAAASSASPNLCVKAHRFCSSAPAPSADSHNKRTSVRQTTCDYTMSQRRCDVSAKTLRIAPRSKESATPALPHNKTPYYRRESVAPSWWSRQAI